MSSMTTIRTQPRAGETTKRRKKKQPSAEVELRIQWLCWLVEKYGPDTVAEWQDPPVGFDEWRAEKALSAHEAA
jgi:hypothetical protein